jgi:hypothetical protein
MVPLTMSYYTPDKRKLVPMENLALHLQPKELGRWERFLFRKQTVFHVRGMICFMHAPPGVKTKPVREEKRYVGLLNRLEQAVRVRMKTLIPGGFTPADADTPSLVWLSSRTESFWMPVAAPLFILARLQYPNGVFFAGGPNRYVLLHGNRPGRGLANGITAVLRFYEVELPALVQARGNLRNLEGEDGL